MPIYKRCSWCGKRIQEGTQCDCKERNQARKQYDKQRADTREKKFYSSLAWQTTRQKAIYIYGGIDLYSYYILGVLEQGEIVHHIEPIRECWDKRLAIDNLIYLTYRNHSYIHQQMEQNEQSKQSIQQLLQSLLKRFLREGDRKNVF